MTFSFTSKPPVLFGNGVVSETGAHAKAFGWTNPILVYDRGVKNAGIAAKVTASLDAAGLTYTEFDGALPDAPDTAIEAAAQAAREAGADGVIAIGGGSSLDLGKCVSILLANPSPITAYWGPRDDLAPVPGTILIPTTAGTGSEVSDTAIILNTELGVKVGVMGEHSKAKLALVDPELTFGLPPAFAAQAALDAFTHGFEAYTGTGHNPISDLYCEKTMSLVVGNLLPALADPGNTVAKTNLSLAATLGGISFGDSMVHLGHNIGQNVAALSHMAHGTSCALGVLAIIEYIADAVPDRLRFVASLFGVTVSDGLDNAELGRELARRYKVFCQNAGVPTSLSEAGVPEEVLPQAAAAIEADPILQVATPKRLDAQTALELLKKIYV
jgi:alcohol dehydrogenase class IV